MDRSEARMIFSLRHLVSRDVVNMPETTTVIVRCPVCGQEHRLSFNGGELDDWEHHGHRFVLEHGPIYLAHYTDHAANDA